MKKSETISRIKQLRSMLCIHSYAYYTLGESMITDEQWDVWAYELVALQKGVWKIGWYDREFYDFDGSTGMHLPKDEWIRSKTLQLLNTHRNIT